MKLNTEQIKLIDKHLRSGMWLTNPQFIAEMQDHYSCAMEEYLNQNIEWNHAIRLIDISFCGRTGLMKMEENYMNSLQKLGYARLWKYCKKYLVSIPHNLLTVCFLAIFYFLATQTKINIAGIFEMSMFSITAFIFVGFFYSLFKHDWNVKKYQQQFHTLNAWFGIWSCFPVLSMNLEEQNSIVLALLVTFMCVCVIIGIEICMDIDWKGEKEIAKA
jgi:hypothetical protein